jgi:PadR family transcriptional regulator, regulatory protein PadR
MRADLVRGHLDLLLLSTVSAGPAHGYAVITALRERSGGVFDLPEGTVYPALHRLERDGLLASRWDGAGGRRRRLYTVTPLGREALAARRQEWHAFAEGVGGVLRLAPGGAR